VSVGDLGNTHIPWYDIVPWVTLHEGLGVVDITGLNLDKIDIQSQVDIPEYLHVRDTERFFLMMEIAQLIRKDSYIVRFTSWKNTFRSSHFSVYARCYVSVDLVFSNKTDPTDTKLQAHILCVNVMCVDRASCVHENAEYLFLHSGTHTALYAHDPGYSSINTHSSEQQSSIAGILRTCDV
jgi:hypothetical protein